MSEPMPRSDGGPENDADRRHLERNRRVWDRWSDHYGLSERDFEPMREDAMARLGVGRGDAVLDIGCGPGVNFDRLRELVGSEGRVVGVDYSPGMVERARARVDDRGWGNVAVVRADATTVEPSGGPFDSAIASLSMSVMPDARATARNVASLLRPGGRFVVFDLRLIPSGPLRVVNPLLSLCLRLVANWNPENDVPGALRATFDGVEAVRTYGAGTAYTAVATRAEETNGGD
ncbi:class I SAM-dependent methyltransferase [Halostella salina]|uniref:class I SAM-dependent methyltransferase n=1 Tax=Halostella salina TaxID=1547897 RepID=UPI000EF7AB02|nr:class I SAM-dependent methyltransferase [Halostella salina]